jgi:hypothetical protein
VIGRTLAIVPSGVVDMNEDVDEGYGGKELCTSTEIGNLADHVDDHRRQVGTGAGGRRLHEADHAVSAERMRLEHMLLLDNLSHERVVAKRGKVSLEGSYVSA